MRGLGRYHVMFSLLLRPSLNSRKSNWVAFAGGTVWPASLGKLEDDGWVVSDI